MRKALLSTALMISFGVSFIGVASLVACGGGDDKFDLAMEQHDLAKVIPDLTVVGRDTCEQVVMCQNAAMDDATYNACLTAGSPTAVPLVNALSACIMTACPQEPIGMQVDSGAGADCVYDPNNDNKFVNNDACSACVMASQNTGGSCATALANCEADKT